MFIFIYVLKLQREVHKNFPSSFNQDMRVLLKPIPIVMFFPNLKRAFQSTLLTFFVTIVLVTFF